MEVVSAIEACGTQEGSPTAVATITNCGILRKNADDAENDLAADDIDGDIDSLDADDLDSDNVNRKINGENRALRLDRGNLMMSDSDEDELEDMDDDINEEVENHHHLRNIALALFVCSKHGTNIPLM